MPSWCRWKNINGTLVCDDCGNSHHMPPDPDPTRWPRRVCVASSPLGESTQGIVIVRLDSLVGNIVHRLVAFVSGEEAKVGCGCGAVINEMNAAGPEGVRKNVDKYVKYLSKKANKQNWFRGTERGSGKKGIRYWKVLNSISRLTGTQKPAIKMLILHACKIAERDIAKNGPLPAITAPPSAKVAVNKNVDVVYAIGDGSIWNNNELRYSLRSLEKYAIDLGKVFIVGAKPKWLTGVVHIPASDACKCNKDANIINKVRMAIKAGCSERFIFASDDQCLLRSVSLAGLPAYAGEDLSKKSAWGKKRWWQRMRATRDYLLTNGQKSVKNFDTHVFQPHMASEFERLVASAPYATKNGFCINTLTLNRAGVMSVPLRGEKAAFYNGKHSLNQVRAICSHPEKMHLGYNDAGLRAGVHRFLAERFPDKSRFELTDMEPLGEYGSPMIVDGSTSLLLGEEIEALVAALPQNGRLLEVGTYQGGTAAMISSRRDDLSIVCVDTFADRKNEKFWNKNKRPNMTVAKGTSRDFLKTNPGLFNVILIDADHKFSPCYNDLKSCRQLVKAGGLLVAHDYRWVPNTHITGKSGVRRAVKLFARRYGYQIQNMSGSLVALTKTAAASPAPVPSDGPDGESGSSQDAME